MTNVFDGYHNDFNAAARLTILRALADEPDRRLNETLLMRVLDAFAFRRGRGYLRTQLRWLEQEVNAVRLMDIDTPSGMLMVAELTEAGQNHLELRTLLDGVMQPSPARR